MIEKVITTNVIKFMLIGEVFIIHLIIELIKKIWSFKVSYFPKSNSHHKSKIKVELELSIYARKFDFKEASGIDQSKFTKKLFN